MDKHIEAGGGHLDAMLEMMHQPPSWVKQRFESMIRGYAYTANTSGMSQTDFAQYEIALEGLLAQLKHDEGVGGIADGGESTRLKRWPESGNVLFVFLEEALQITYGDHREWFAENVAMLRIAKLWRSGQWDYDLGSIVLLPAMVFLRTIGKFGQAPGFVARDYSAFVLRTLRTLREAASGGHFSEIATLAKQPRADAAGFRKRAPQLDLIFTCYADRFYISTLLNELSGATWRAVVKANTSPHAAESMLFNLQTDVFMRRTERPSESDRARPGHLDSQPAIIAAADGTASNAEIAYSRSERARLVKEGLKIPSREHFRLECLRRKSVAEFAAALHEKLERKATAAAARKGSTPWTAVVKSKREVIANQGGPQHDVAFEKAEKQAAAERELDSNAQSVAVVRIIGSTAFLGGAGADVWGRLRSCAPRVALPLGRFLVLAASARTRQLVGEVLGDGKKAGAASGGSRSGSRSKAKPQRLTNATPKAAAAAAEKKPTNAQIVKQGAEAAQRLRSVLCRGYSGATTKHVSFPIPSAAALKAATAAVRADTQAWLKSPNT